MVSISNGVWHTVQEPTEVGALSFAQLRGSHGQAFVSGAELRDAIAPVEGRIKQQAQAPGVSSALRGGHAEADAGFGAARSFTSSVSSSLSRLAGMGTRIVTAGPGTLQR